MNRWSHDWVRSTERRAVCDVMVRVGSEAEGDDGNGRGAGLRSAGRNWSAVAVTGNLLAGSIIVIEYRWRVQQGTVLGPQRNEYRGSAGTPAAAGTALRGASALWEVAARQRRAGCRTAPPSRRGAARLW